MLAEDKHKRTPPKPSDPAMLWRLVICEAAASRRLKPALLCVSIFPSSQRSAELQINRQVTLAQFDPAKPAGFTRLIL